MRALIRGKEVCLENEWTKWQRMNLLFLTGKEVVDENGVSQDPGDGWTLVEDYTPSEPVEGFEEPQPVQTTSIQEKPVEQPAVRSGSEDAGTQSPSEPLPETRSDSEGAVTESPSTVSIGGKEYTLDELKKLIE